MGFKINSSTIIAVFILLVVAGWMATGEVIKGGQVDESVPTIAERNAEKETKSFKVRTTFVEARERENILPIRGRTQAASIVPIRVKTSGTVEKRFVEKGDLITAGTRVCELDKGTRQSDLNNARTRLQQAEFDLNSNTELLEQGFATKSRMQALRAALNNAKADFDKAKQELDRTLIVATVGGIVQDSAAKIGDTLNIGEPCVTLVDLDPMNFTTQVSEQEILKVKVGQTAGIQLITGQKFAGTVDFIASSADPRTRTFTVNIKLPNPDGTILDGITANGGVQLSSEPGFLLNPSWLVLSDNGNLGVRVVDIDKKVAFREVEIQQQAIEGIWVSGLTNGDQIITLGQEFVSTGEIVETVNENVNTAELNQ